MYRYILFDLDGTLTDPADGITKCVQFALAHFGIAAECDALTCFIGPPLLEQFMAYAGFDREQAEEAVVWYRRRYTDIGIFENRVLDGVPALLRTLMAHGKTLCVASSKPEVFVRRILDKYGLTSFFTVICGGELDGRRTNKAEVIAETLARLGYQGDRRDVLMVGDRIHDVMGGTACHVDTLGVTFGYAPAGELEASAAVAVVDSMEEVQNFILKNE